MEKFNNMGDASTEIAYWEDMRDSRVHRYGPLVFTTELLDKLLDMLGEKHPIHTGATKASGGIPVSRIVPGGYIHAVTSGWIVEHGSAAAIVGLRSMHWDFVRPLLPDVPFYFTTETEESSVVNSSVGLISSLRRVTDEDDQTYAIGRMNALVRRRENNI
ncbi:MaoC family dehydratase [uncultured Propionibacterium sp.]|uniref:MaoC family dehydratase n=1 Tax=uncultured Propionibacterium sp. TaxID=218066 RepID=UPI00292F54D9|nr:MaoC family dehydratase [uncultured Propionibacterium sp.]